MHWLSYIFPRTMVKTSSRFNRDIRVVEESGEYKLLVNGATETGPYIRKLLQFAVSKLGISKAKNVRNVLVLGVAGGTIIHMLHALYPRARITGIDIDSAMIDIGKKYFGLGDIPKLSLIAVDAKDFITQPGKKKYDLIVIDLFIGREIPEFETSIEFLTNIQSLLSSKGFVFINYLKELEYPKEIQEVFSKVEHVDIEYNRFFLAQK